MSITTKVYLYPSGSVAHAFVISDDLLQIRILFDNIMIITSSPLCWHGGIVTLFLYLLNIFVRYNLTSIKVLTYFIWSSFRLKVHKLFHVDSWIVYAGTKRSLQNLKWRYELTIVQFNLCNSSILPHQMICFWAGRSRGGTRKQQWRHSRWCCGCRSWREGARTCWTASENIKIHDKIWTC